MYVYMYIPIYSRQLCRQWNWRLQMWLYLYEYSQSHLGWHFPKLKAQSSNVSFATFQWKETFELWALSFETAFENVTPNGIGCLCISVYTCVFMHVHVCVYTCIRIKINCRQFPLAATFSCYLQLVCMYIYTQIYTYLYTHIYTYIYAYVHTCIYWIVVFPWRVLCLAIFSWCTHVYRHMDIHLYIYTYMYTCTCTFIRSLGGYLLLSFSAGIYACIHIYIHMYIHVYARIHFYVHI